MMRPSNSGIATLIAVSSEVSPRLDTSHASRAMPLVIAWMTGIPNRSNADGASAPPSPSANDNVEITTLARPLTIRSAAGMPSSSARRLDV